jgi:acyl carrier protein
MRRLPESHQHGERIPDIATPERPAHDQSLPAMHDLPIEVPQRVRERVLDILAEELTDRRWLDLLNEKPVEEWSVVHDLRMDSLDWCCFCLRLEEEFDMNRDIADGSDPKTVGDFIRLVEAHLSGE